MNRDAVEDLLRPQAVAWARFARTRPDEWVQRLAEVKLLHDYAGRLSESFEAVTKTHTFRTTGAERTSSPILDSPVHTPCSKDRSPTHGGGMYFDPKTAPVSLPRPPSSQKNDALCTDLLLHSTILRALRWRRCWLASWPSCGAGAIRSARSGVACVTARVTHPCSTVLLTRGTTDGCQLTM